MIKKAKVNHPKRYCTNIVIRQNDDNFKIAYSSIMKEDYRMYSYYKNLSAWDKENNKAQVSSETDKFTDKYGKIF